MKLELKHLIPYADKKCYYLTREKTKLIFDCEDLYDIQNMIHNDQNDWCENYKLLLHPLSDLIKDDDIFEILGIALWENDFLLSLYEKYSMINWITDLSKMNGEDILNGHYTYDFFELLFKNHYDLFDLIENRLAIDINTLKNV